MNRRQSEVILRPVINEKSVALANTLQQYTFEVARDANKIEIAHAIEQLLKDLYPKNKNSVVRVNTSATRGRFRRSKRHGRFPCDGKKAIVTITGDPIEIFSA